MLLFNLVTLCVYVWVDSYNRILYLVFTIKQIFFIFDTQINIASVLLKKLLKIKAGGGAYFNA